MLDDCKSYNKYLYQRGVLFALLRGQIKRHDLIPIRRATLSSFEHLFVATKCNTCKLPVKDKLTHTWATSIGLLKW